MTSNQNNKTGFALYCKDRFLESAKTDSLPDVVFSIVAYNFVNATRWPEAPVANAIDPFEILPDAPREVVEMWIPLSYKLLGSGDPVGEAMLCSPSTFEYHKKKFIAENPGFSADSYEYAISLGAKAMR